MELKSSANREVTLLFDQCLNGWFVQHRSLTLRPDRDVLCNRLWGTAFLQDFDPKHVIHKACFAGTSIMTKHKQLLVCGLIACVFLYLPLLHPLSSLLIAFHQFYLILISRWEYCQTFISFLLKWLFPWQEVQALVSIL